MNHIMMALWPFEVPKPWSKVIVVDEIIDIVSFQGTFLFFQCTVSEKKEQKFWGRSMWRLPYKVPISRPHVNAHRGACSQEALEGPEDRIYNPSGCWLWLLLATLRLFLGCHVGLQTQCSHGDRNGPTAWVPLATANVAPAATEFFIFQHDRSMLSPRYGAVMRGPSEALGGKLIIRLMDHCKSFPFTLSGVESLWGLQQGSVTIWRVLQGWILLIC